jgi:hypothetical protein
MFFKKNETVLTFHTSGSQQKIDLFSPRYGNQQLLPNWYRTISKDPNAVTLRSCPAFADLHKNSIGIPLWTDMTISYKGNRVTRINAPYMYPDMIQPHHEDQWGAGFANSFNVKLLSPWYVTANRDTPFLMHDAVWHKENLDEYQVLSGIINFKYQHSSHINMMFPISEEEKTVELKAGTILAYLTPLSETKIKIKTQWETEEKLNSYKFYRFSFNDNDYRKGLKIKENLKE